MNARRPWLILVYGLATLVAQCVHDHGDRGADSPAVGLAGCDDPRPHFAGHGAPELRPGDLHCPACSFRDGPPIAPSGPARFSAVVARLTPAGEVTPPAARRTRGPSPRAPPLA